MVARRSMWNWKHWYLFDIVLFNNNNNIIIIINYNNNKY